MKRLLLLVTLAIFTANYLLAQVELGKTKNNLSGKNGIIASPSDKIMLNDFSINLVLYGFAEDQGGGGAQVGIRAHLTQVDEPLAQEMVNEAYAYFVEQWKKRGVEVYSPSIEEIEATKKYSKAKSKDNAKIISGGTFDNKEKKNHNMMAWPEGTNIASSGSGPLVAHGNSAHVVPDYKGNFSYTSFNTTINFIEFKTAALGSTASVRTMPQLKASNGLSVIKWEKTKYVLYTANNNPEGIEDFYSDLDKDGFEFLGTSSNDWNYIADVAKYKSNVMEMIKKGMDDLFTDYDAVVAENN
ncbi:MAG: hypothetical protein ACJA08_003576 [Cyclobacteriaceae bacterium]|jgi:hypothetical protein